MNQLLLSIRLQRLPFAWVLFFLLVGGSGCSEKWLDLSLMTPEAQVTEVRVLERTERAVRMELLVELTNPNAVDLPLREVDYRVSVPKAGSFHFVMPPVATLPAEGRQTLRLPAVLEVPTGQEQTFRVSGTVSYEPPGELRRIMTDSGMPLPLSRFSAEGPLGPGP